MALAALALAAPVLADDRLQRAREALDRRDLAAAAAQLQPLLESDDATLRLQARYQHARWLLLSQRIEEAESSAQRLETELRAAFGAGDADALGARQLRIAALLAAGRWPQALPLAQALPADIAAALGEGHALYALAQRTAINALRASGQRNAALDEAARLYRSLGAGGESLAADRAARLAAEIADDASRYEEALDWAERAYRGLRERLGADHWETIAALRLRATALFELGETDRAARLLESVVADARGDDAAIGRARRELARFLLALRRPAAAVQLLADELRLATTEANDVRVELARALLAAGRIEEACEQAAAARQAFAAAPGADPWPRLRADQVYAACLGARGELDRAAELLAEGHAASVLRNGETNTDTLDVLARWAAVELQRGARARARQLLERFVAGAEAARAAAHEASATRRTQFARWAAGESAAGYATLARLLLEDGEAQRALQILELARARRVGDAIAVRAAAPERWLGAADLRRLREAEDALALSEAALARAADEAARLDASVRRSDAAAALAKLRRELAARYPQYGARLSQRPVEAADVRRALRAGEALVALHVLGERVGALLVTRESLRALDLGRVAGLESLVATVGRVARGEPVRLWRSAGGALLASFVRPAADAERVPAQEAAAALVRALWQPIERALVRERIGRVTISPDGALAALPFELLPVRGVPLALRYELAYAPSLTAFVAERRRGGGAARRVLAIGAPDYAALTATGGGHWPPLPGAAAELRALADALGAQRVTALAGAEASAERLRALSRSGALQSIDVLHVAAHAVAAADAPERSALILGLAPGLAAESARLSAPEVAALRLGARLVVFSACDTASGRWQPGEGILGLPQAIFTAAQATTVLTRWAVPDEGAAVFMRRFYRHLAAGRSAVSALARARAEARAGHAADRDARVWAGFIAYGAW